MLCSLGVPARPVSASWGMASVSSAWAMQLLTIRSRDMPLPPRDLSKDQEGHDDHHQSVGQNHRSGEIEPYRRKHHGHASQLERDPLRHNIRGEHLFDVQLLRQLYSSASCKVRSPRPVRLKDFTTLMPCTYSSTASTNLASDF